MSLQVAKPQHEVAYQDLTALVSKNADQLSSVEILAIAANMVGKLIAMQDQREVTPQMAMEIVATNIEYGNQSVLSQLNETAGNT